MADRKVTAPVMKAWERYFDARDQGLSVEAAARKSKLSPSTCYRFERGDQSSTGLDVAQRLGRTMVGGNLVQQPLTIEASEALEDFAKFRLRFFGRKSVPWQERAAYDIMRYLTTPDREYVVINCPPGSGKSTLFTNDIPCWLIARDRSIRIQIGSRTERQARMYVGRIKKTLERDAPLRADADSLTKGIAFDALSCMQDDFGGFKPEGRSELWRGEALVVRQLDGVSLDDKEPTVSAWGQDSGFLGGRYDLVIWDDLVDRKNTKTPESKDNIREWWGTEAETRLEPGGVLVLQGQRIAHDDLYRYALDQKKMDETPKYRHIVYPAHDDDNCRGHDNDKTETPKAWPDGCLLDPHRLPWVTLQTTQNNSPRVYDVQYQQRDGELVGGLIQEAWLKGGLDDDGYNAPGCLDTERSVNEIPAHLKDGAGWSHITVDPSPTEWWGIIWWLYDPVTERRYAIDLIRRRMNPEQFLSLDLDTYEFSGLMEDIRKLSNILGAPISHIIVEVNAAQRWLLSQPHVQRWMQGTGVVFVPHTTTINKADPKFGVESTGDLFRQGKIRLPYADVVSRQRTSALTSEALKYPDSDTTDMVMSTWFHKLGVENHYAARRKDPLTLPVPGWMRGIERGMAGATRGWA